MHGFKAVICGFSDTGTGSQDYGQGILRVDSRLIEDLMAHGHRISRNDLVRVENKTNDRLFAVLRVAELDDPRKIALELDDRFKLAVEKGHIEELFIRKAYRIEAIQYFWSHINLIVRIEFKLAIFLTTISLFLGATVSLILAF